MKFGLSFSVVVPPDGPLSWSQVAQDMVILAPEVEALGYDSLHVLEHHFQKDGWNPITTSHFGRGFRGDNHPGIDH